MHRLFQDLSENVAQKNRDDIKVREEELLNEIKTLMESGEITLANQGSNEKNNNLESESSPGKQFLSFLQQSETSNECDSSGESEDEELLALESKLLDDMYLQSMKEGKENPLLENVRTQLKLWNKSDFAKQKKLTKKRWWTREEDNKLKSLVNKHGVF